MSKTFNSNSSRVSRGGASDRGGVRGTGSRPSIGVGRSRAAGPILPTGASQRGRGVTEGRTVRPHQTFNSSSNNTRSSIRGSLGSSNRARGKMDTSRNFGGSGRYDEGLGASGKQDPQRQENDLEGRGQHAGGYTVFSPNEKRRRQISEMAQRETEAYERYKQEKSGKTFSYVGTVGGGELNHDQVRARQANEVRAQKFNRLMRQENFKQSARQAEAESIQAKKDEARRKAELNAQRQARTPAADEIRRKREAFLSQFDRREPAGEDAFLPHNVSASGSQAERSLPSVSRGQPQHRDSYSSNNNNNTRMVGRGGTTTTTSPISQAVPAVKTESGAVGGRNAHREQDVSNFHSQRRQTNGSRAYGGVDATGRFPRRPVKLEADVKQEPNEGVNQEEEEDSAAASDTTQMDEEIGILCSMFPDMCLEELKNILLQAGSLDQAIDTLDFGR